ncbi:rRNA biogenesis protein rrp36 [Elasticomyces elasticus]|nr:rRNA biogenesis protein rrp36 [Elasticomyces elasticus]
MPRPVQKTVRPRHEDEVDSNASEFESEAQDSEQGSEDDGGSGDSSQSSIESEDDTAPEEDLKDIDFGTLAQVQAKLNPSKRKHEADEPEVENNPRSAAKEFRDQQEEKERDDRPEKIARTSKHAPAMMSSKNPVSRRRQIFSPPPAEKSRDPRFDAAVVADGRRGNFASTTSANRNYAFLNDYQAAEVLNLKSQIKKTKDPDQQAELKRKVMSIEAKLRNAQTRTREEDILREHKKSERQAIREGKKSKPYYLKESEVKKQIVQERHDALSKRAKDKSEKRKKMREKTKDARDMPRQRRVV